MAILTFVDLPAMPEPLEPIMQQLGNKRAGVVIDFIAMLMVVRDPETPENEFYGNPNDHPTGA